MIADTVAVNDGLDAIVELYLCGYAYRPITPTDIVQIRTTFATLEQMATTVTEADVIEALRPVEDPELHRSIVDLNMVRNIDIRGNGVVGVLIALTVPGCPLKNEIQRRVSDAATQLDGVDSIDLEFTVMTDEDREASAQAHCMATPGRRQVTATRTDTPRAVKSRSPRTAPRRGRC